MYKYSDKMFFDEDENYIKSLSSRSHKKVKCVCPFCNKKRLLAFSGVNINNSTACAGCSIKERNWNSVIGKKFGALTVLSRDTCKNQGQYVVCRCDCGKQTTVRLSSLKDGNTRSCGCLQTNMMKSKVGPLHPNFGKRGVNSPAYNPNITDEQREIAIRKRRNVEAYHFRKAVKERDHNICVICGAEEKLVVHHLESFKDNESLRYEVSNGVTLCRDCHTEFHCTWMGGYRVSCTGQDFNEYVLQI